jgi:hypothetical protein
MSDTMTNTPTDLVEKLRSAKTMTELNALRLDCVKEMQSGDRGQFKNTQREFINAKDRIRNPKIARLTAELEAANKKLEAANKKLGVVKENIIGCDEGLDWILKNRDVGGIAVNTIRNIRGRLAEALAAIQEGGK